MTLNSTRIMPYANNITVTTELSYCDNTTWNLNRTLYALRDLYQNNHFNLTSHVFLNISSINYNCTSAIERYFEQIITFTQTVSIRIQILFASIYFDYLNASNFQLNGFVINPKSLIQLSSITVNNICTQLSNPWKFACSELGRVMLPIGLNSWQLGLIGGFSAIFVLLLVLLSGLFYRRYRHSKQLALSCVNLYDDVKVLQNSGIPQGQAFQRVATILQPERRNHTATSWIHDGTAMNNNRHDEKSVDFKSSESDNQVTFVDHAKIHDPTLPFNTLPKSKTSVIIPTSPSNRSRTAILSRPLSRTSLTQLKLITSELQEHQLNECDNISSNRSISNRPKDPNTSISRHFASLSFVDENLTDEDAWMSILEVVYAELARLDEQDITRTLL